MIAAKYEEIYPPSVTNFSYITDNSYTKDQIREIEIEILACLDFNVTFPTPLRFLERFAKLSLKMWINVFIKKLKRWIR